MVCNTIHLFYDRLKKEINIPIINLREEVGRILKEKNIRSTVVMGSPGVINGGLYEYKNIETRDLSKNDIDRTTKAIFRFNKGINKNKQAEIVRNIVTKHIKRTKVQMIVSACTEVSLMLKEANLPILDTMDVLLEATLKRLNRF
jgi:aspartate racemase